jgi:hypothetical protein
LKRTKQIITKFVADPVPVFAQLSGLDDERKTKTTQATHARAKQSAEQAPHPAKANSHL